MQLTVAKSHFDLLQQRLIEEIIAVVHEGLREAGVEDEQMLFEATGNLTFSIAAILDGSHQITLNDTEVIPRLMFAKQRGDSELISSGTEGSWMHEYVFALVEDLWAANDDL